MRASGAFLRRPGRARDLGMRIHALGSSSGLTYAQMGQYAAKPDAPVQFTDFNGGTFDTKYAQVDPATGRPVSNGARNVWTSETSLSTALYLAFAATGISLFAIVVGIALLLSGIGFLILALAVFGRKEAAPEGSSAAPSAETGTAWHQGWALRSQIVTALHR